MKLKETVAKLKDDVYGCQRETYNWMARVSRCVVEDSLVALPAVAARQETTPAAAMITSSCDETSSSKKNDILEQTQPSSSYCGGVRLNEVSEGSILEAFHLAKRSWRIAEVCKIFTRNMIPPEPHVQVKFLELGESAEASSSQHECEENVALTWTRPVSSSHILLELGKLLDGDLSRVIHSVRAPLPVLQDEDSKSDHAWERVAGMNERKKELHPRGCRGGNRWKREGGRQKKTDWFSKLQTVHQQSPHLSVPSKYWAQRYRYWGRFDEGITMYGDDWFSVTPEAVAVHIAHRAKCGVLIDAFCGCGGNAVRFAGQSRLVICIDKNPKALIAARINATVYGVANRIEFIVGDAMELLPSMTADAVFLSPPWGGPGYSKVKKHSLFTMLAAPLDGVKVFHAARRASQEVIYFVPRNCDSIQLASLADDVSGEVCEVETHWLNNKLKTKAAYYGKLATSSSSSGLDPGKNVFERSSSEDGKMMDTQVMADTEDDLYKQWQKQIS